MNDRTGKWLPYSVTTGKLHQCAKPKYNRKSLYELSISHIGDIPQLDEPTDDQKQWVLRRLKGPAWTWERWYK